jgi:hypothetical protein
MNAETTRKCRKNRGLLKRTQLVGTAAAPKSTNQSAAKNMGGLWSVGPGGLPLPARGKPAASVALPPARFIIGLIVVGLGLVVALVVIGLHLDHVAWLDVFDGHRASGCHHLRSGDETDDGPGNGAVGVLVHGVVLVASSCCGYALILHPVDSFQHGLHFRNGFEKSRLVWHVGRFYFFQRRNNRLRESPAS